MGATEGEHGKDVAEEILEADVFIFAYLQPRELILDPSKPGSYYKTLRDLIKKDGNFREELRAILHFLAPAAYGIHSWYHSPAKDRFLGQHVLFSFMTPVERGLEKLEELTSPFTKYNIPDLKNPERITPKELLQNMLPGGTTYMLYSVPEGHVNTPYSAYLLLSSNPREIEVETKKLNPVVTSKVTYKVPSIIYLIGRENKGYPNLFHAFIGLLSSIDLGEDILLPNKYKELITNRVLGEGKLPEEAVLPEINRIVHVLINAGPDTLHHLYSIVFVGGEWKAPPGIEDLEERVLENFFGSATIDYGKYELSASEIADYCVKKLTEKEWKNNYRMII